MADDQIQKTYRASQPPVRNASGNAAPSPSDPLAELARLIGQNDPFGEYGRGRGDAAQAEAPAAYAQAPESDVHADAASRYADERCSGVPTYGDDQYPPEPASVGSFLPPPAPPPQYAHEDFGDATYAAEAYGQGEQGPYYPNTASSGAEEEHFYDDAPPRRRLGIIAIAAVFALAVIGTVGAFGYRALFGSSAPSGPPPVIKAETTPSKIVPAADSKDPKSSKLIYDRVNNNGQNEKIVSREEQPVDIKDKPVGTVLPQGQSAPGGSMRQSALGSGVVGVEPKKIHTIAIHPNQAAGSASGQPPVAASAPAPMPAPAPAHAQPAPPAKPPRAAAEPAPRPVAHAEAPARHAAAPSNAPLSLSPNASAPARTAQRSVRTAAVAATPTRIAPARAVAPTHTAPTRAAAPTRIAPAASSGGYAVQIASRHNEADAKVSFHSLQAKYPRQLGGRQPLIRRVDLGAKGIYYRAMVGPFGSAEEASKLCSSLKAAGGQCLIQRI
jgi:hypothetical protein